MSEFKLEDLTEEQLAAALKQKKQAAKDQKAKAKKEYLAKKEDFCNSAAKAFDLLHTELKDLKKTSCSEAHEIYDLMFTMENRTPKETKSFSIKNQADNIKIVVERQERFEFTDEAIVHINAIRDIFKSKFSERNKGMYSILDGLLVKNSKMEYDPKLLAKARRQVRDLGDDELINEFDKLDECQEVTGSALYCRLYRRDSDGKWQDVSLQFSSL